MFYSINDGAEDTEHFLLPCHSYHLQRNNLFSQVEATLLSYGLSSFSNEEFNLYGDEMLPFESYKTLEFIESLKDFLKSFQ